MCINFIDFIFIIEVYNYYNQIRKDENIKFKKVKLLKFKEIYLVSNLKFKFKMLFFNFFFILIQVVF